MSGVLKKVPRWFLEGRNKVFECTITIAVKARDEHDAKAIVDTLIHEGSVSPFIVFLVGSKPIECKEVSK